MGEAAAVIGVISSVIGLGANLLGDVQATQSAVALNDYRIQVANRNAALASENAYRAINVGQEAQVTQDEKSAALFAEQTTQQAASGISLDSRSLVQTRESAKRLARVDALNVRQAAAVEAFNYASTAADYKSEADFLTEHKSDTVIAGSFQTIGNFARNATGVANSFDNLSTYFQTQGH